MRNIFQLSHTLPTSGLCYCIHIYCFKPKICIFDLRLGQVKGSISGSESSAKPSKYQQLWPQDTPYNLPQYIKLVIITRAELLEKHSKMKVQWFYSTMTGNSQALAQNRLPRKLCTEFWKHKTSLLNTSWLWPTWFTISINSV